MNLDDRSQMAIGRFTLTFLLSTEFFSYFVIIPLLLIYFLVNLDISLNNLVLLLKVLAVVIPISMATTYVSDIMVLSPIRRYFKKILKGEGAGDEDYAAAQKRFFSLPFAHAAGSLVRWIAGLVGAYVPFTLLADLSGIQTFNIWTTAVVIPPFGMVLYFFLTERFLQKYLNLGFFADIRNKEAGLKINFVLRIVLSIAVMISVPLIGVIGYFLLILERQNVSGAIVPIKMAMILLFGVLIAGSLTYGLAGSIGEKVSMIISYLRTMGEGDLSQGRLVMAVVDDLTRIGQNVFVMKENIADIIHEIRRISGGLEESTGKISGITESFTQDTQGQAATTEEVTAAIEEISAGMDSIAHSTRRQVESIQSLVDKMNGLTSKIKEMDRKTANAQRLTEEISREAKSGEEALARMKESMHKIGERSGQMTGIVGIINDISEKINLLSLNASIEAARAGDAGRGFAVVADEVSKLADTTASSVKEIGALIKASEEETEQGAAIVGDVVEKISRITGGVGEINDMTESLSSFMHSQIETNEVINREAGGVKEKSEEIEASIAEQKNAMGEMVRSVNGINELTQSISSGSQEIAGSSKENLDMAKLLMSKVDSFTVA
jgi:methyl-accepting chemotaxis protein